MDGLDFDQVNVFREQRFQGLKEAKVVVGPLGQGNILELDQEVKVALSRIEAPVAADPNSSSLCTWYASHNREISVRLPSTSAIIETSPWPKSLLSSIRLN